MASENLVALLERVNTDPQFRMEFERNPENILSSYKLTQQEKDAVLSRRTARLRELDVDIRIAKGWAADNGNKAHPTT
ncbi:hypothetical protein [Cytobacillus oceanisediminis]|uniref:hypothetical protein n=1 Tax=Cytobacillus oceanisediminis TaxID=665099 RepID=UPI00203A8079|nr:hypothetical protein [Cytobacillus oceanisediminis]MCM3393138.1 hypothetical protein [Cytobacillus oceanisediminis]